MKNNLKKKNKSNNKRNINWPIVLGVATLAATILMPLLILLLEYNMKENEIKEQERIKAEFVQNLSNDLSQIHINDVLGEPIYSYFSGDISNNYYVVNDNVIKCMYDNDKLIGYLIFINTNSPLEYDTWINENSQLGDFTYSDIDMEFNKIYKTDYAFALTTMAYRYYFEVYKGNMSNTNGEYFVLGNYMDKNIDLVLDEYDNYININKLSVIEDKNKFYLKNIRSKIKPNVYGQVKEEYLKKVHLIDQEGNVNNSNIIYNIFGSYDIYE